MADCQFKHLSRIKDNAQIFVIKQSWFIVLLNVIIAMKLKIQNKRVSC